MNFLINQCVQNLKEKHHETTAGRRFVMTSWNDPQQNHTCSQMQSHVVELEIYTMTRKREHASTMLFGILQSGIN